MKTKIIIIYTLIILSINCYCSDFPKTANLWGCPPNTQDFKTWAKYDMLVCYESPYNAFINLSKGTRAINPDIIILGTTPLANFANPDKWYPWIKSEWRLKDTQGKDITWWAGQVYTPNLLAEGTVDALVSYADGKLGDRGGKTGDLIKENIIQGLMHDSVISTISLQGDIDTDLDGKRDNYTSVNKKWSEAQNLYFSKLRKLHPDIIIMANDADDTHMPYINARLWESARNLDLLMNTKVWSILDVVNKTNEWTKNSVAPPCSFSLASSSLGYDSWRVGLDEKNVATKGEVDRAIRELDRMRLGLYTTLMTDAFYGYDFGTVYYGNPNFWYAEYEAPLGNPTGNARAIFEKKPKNIIDWKAGDTNNIFNGRENIGKLTEDGYKATCSDNSDTWNVIFSTDPKILNFRSGKTYNIELECLILERATECFQFALRSEKGGWEFADRGRQEYIGTDGKTITVKMTAVPGNYDDYRLEGFLKGNGSLLVKKLTVQEVGEYYMERDFTNGKVILNAKSKPITIKLPMSMRKIKDDFAPKTTIEIDNENTNLTRSNGAWLTAEGAFNRYCGKNHIWSLDKDASFTWDITVPESDTYSIFASLPGDYKVPEWKVYPESNIPFTKTAIYRIKNKTFTVNQSDADGGWVKIASLNLIKDKKYTISVNNTEEGRLAADSIRLESKTRRNNGAVINKVTLSPLDGIILLK